MPKKPEIIEQIGEGFDDVMSVLVQATKKPPVAKDKDNDEKQEIDTEKSEKKGDESPS